ncbi:MAG: FAD-binding protein [Acidimicrobiia bacterium]|nr:FAD-binding protein [Acidimicrobiia bacterium]
MTRHPDHLTRLATEIEGAPEAELVLAPKNTEDVASILRYASDKGMPVQVWGGGTRQGYGTPPPPGIVMSTSNLNAIEAWEPEDLTLVVAPGAKVVDVESMLADRSQTAVLPEVPGSSTVGGALAAGVSAFRRGRLYSTRERVLETRVVTGDGRIVRSGARVVKNVSGYDLARLCVGAFGSLGVVVSVCFKLFPNPPAAATVRVENPNIWSVIARPLAVLETREGTDVFIRGTEEEVQKKADRLGGVSRDGHHWPRDPLGPFQWRIGVPPALVSEALARLPEDWPFVAVHGVGEIRAASETVDGAVAVREWSEAVGGHLVAVSRPDEAREFDPWGRPPAALGLQRRLISHFDPARVINPGRLPGGL